MTVKALVTPSVLHWAREDAGYFKEEVSAMLKAKRVTAEVIDKWEKGEAQPSMPQLRKIAEMYKRSTFFFYYKKLRIESSVERADFRSVPSNIIKDIPPRIRYLVRKAKVRIADLEQLLPDAGTAEVHSLRIDGAEDAKGLARRIREVIGITPEEQCKWSKDPYSAFKTWRELLGELGVWVFKNKFKEQYKDSLNDEYCGFCMNNDKFPIIYINSKQDIRRQIFTLFHELGHLLKGAAGVDFRSEPVYPKEYQKIEVFCNDFAGSFLVPWTGEVLNHSNPDYDTLCNLADRYKVSFDVVLRRFRDQNIISQDKFSELRSHREQKTKDYQNRTKGGPSYLVKHSSYLGKKYLQLVFSEYHKNRLDEFQAAKYLGVKVQNLDGFTESNN